MRITLLPTLAESELAIDRMVPAQQVSEYPGLREKILSADFKDRSTVVTRLSQKIALANARASTPNPGHAQRLAFCEQAVNIGQTYIRQGDPYRYLRRPGCREKYINRNIRSESHRERI